MAYNTKSIVKDVNQKPVPQIFDMSKDAYEVLQGKNGANRVMVYDVNGNPVDLVALVNSIMNLDPTRTFYGLSTETKPTSNNIKGNKYFEINTGEVYMWNGTSWVVI